MRLAPELRCPRHAERPLAVETAVAGEGLACPSGCRFPVVRGIARFSASDSYAEGFGLQWKAYRRTQLDSYTGTRISRDRLERCLGGSIDGLRGRSVLEAGCGAGRFTEILLAAGARVFAFDLSQAVEANLENCGAADGYFVCQADALQIPAAPLSFDIVVALGVVQHTPSPEATIRSLATRVRPGGLLVIDHYRVPSPVTRMLLPFLPRTVLRAILLRLSPIVALRATQRITRSLLPVHRLLWRRGPVVDRLRFVWRRLSPVFDYYDSYPELGARLEEWAYLDTHDGLTDYYKHLRTAAQIRARLEELDLHEIHVAEAGNGIEARARRPLASTSLR